MRQISRATHRQASSAPWPIRIWIAALAGNAADLAVSPNILLAYATAHEVIHLLRGPAHSSSGVMKEYWTRRDSIAIAQLNLPVPKPGK